MSKKRRPRKAGIISIGTLNVAININPDSEMRTATTEKLSCVVSWRTTTRYKGIFDRLKPEHFLKYRDMSHAFFDECDRQYAEEELKAEEAAVLARHYRHED